jgi:hypothetical protein
MPLSTNEITLLRSQLQNVSEDLQSLTNADIIQMKWSIRKRILTSLLAQSPTLRDQSEELEELLEKRSIVLNEQRKTTASSNDSNREARIESEKTFRTTFMRIVLAALTMLQWPPGILTNTPLSIYLSISLILILILLSIFIYLYLSINQSIYLPIYLCISYTNTNTNITISTSIRSILRSISIFIP